MAAAQAWQQCSQAAGYRVEIVQRDVNWAAARGRWDVGTGLKNQAQLDALIAFFRARKGKAYGFRFKDWTDFKALGQLIGTGDDATTVFQLVKRYPSLRRAAS